MVVLNDPFTFDTTCIVGMQPIISVLKVVALDRFHCICIHSYLGSNFQDPSNNVTDSLLKFRGAIIQELNGRVCPSCGLTVPNIRNDEFSCHGGLTNRIVYRAMIIGTDTYSAPSLVSLIQSWVTSGSASVTVFSTRLRLDMDCAAFLDTFNDPDCPLKIESRQTTTAPKPKENISPSSPHHVGASEIVGFLIGSIVIILLAVLLLVIAIIALKKYKFKM